MRRSYVWREGQGFVEFDRKARRTPGLTIISDLATPFQSPVDGSWITSKAERREHNVVNECVDIGNDSTLHHPKQDYVPIPNIEEDISRAYDQLDSGQVKVTTDGRIERS